MLNTQARVSVSDTLPLRRQIEVLQMSPRERRRRLYRMAQQVRRFSRKRAQQQRDVNGTPWQGRKDGKRRKMMRGLAKTMTASSTDRHGTVTWRSAITGRIAYAHAHGIPEKMTASRMQRVYGTPDYEAPATRGQARALREAGFQIRRASGKGWKKPTLRWVTENMKQGQAGLVLTELNHQEHKKSWDIPLPERSFLGATEAEAAELIDGFFKQTQRQLRR